MIKMEKQYTKKPVIISAVQFTGKNISEILEFADNEKNVGYDVEKNQYYIKTLEGNHYITDGDYIIRGVEGEYYPCKERIFKKTYTEKPLMNEEEAMNKTCNMCKYLEIINNGRSGIYAKCTYKTLYFWRDDTRKHSCDCWEGQKKGEAE